MKRKQTKLQSMHMRAAAHRRELKRNPLVKQALGGRAISSEALRTLWQHFDRLRPRAQRINNIMGSLERLDWLTTQIERRKRIKLVSSRSAMDHAISNAEKHHRETLLREFHRLWMLLCDVLVGNPVDDPEGAYRDLLMLYEIWQEFIKRGGNKTKSRALPDALTTGAGDSVEHRALTRAIAKANGDRMLAIKNVCRLYTVKSLDQLPAHIKSAVHDALP